MTIFAIDIGLSFFTWETVVILFIVSFLFFLASEVLFLLCKYNELDHTLLLVSRFSLELTLLFMSKPFSFDMYGFTTLLNLLLLLYLMVVELFRYDVVLILFVYQIFANKVLD